jgi:thioredoxin reductase (NADPH)
LKLDERGFVLTGGDDRFPLETNKRGIFAVGDVRSASVKRVAASVGDGAQVVAAIHQYLAAQEKERPISIQPQMQVTPAE